MYLLSQSFQLRISDSLCLLVQIIEKSLEIILSARLYMYYKVSIKLQYLYRTLYVPTTGSRSICKAQITSNMLVGTYTRTYEYSYDTIVSSQIPKYEKEHSCTRTCYMDAAHDSTLRVCATSTQQVRVYTYPYS